MLGQGSAIGATLRQNECPQKMSHSLGNKWKDWSSAGHYLVWFDISRRSRGITGRLFCFMDSSWELLHREKIHRGWWDGIGVLFRQDHGARWFEPATAKCGAL